MKTNSIFKLEIIFNKIFSVAKKVVEKDLFFLAFIPCVIFFIFFLFRSQGVLPSVMADEWHYSSLARLIPFANSNDPGFLYLSIMGVTNHCGLEYLSCARIMNVLFFITGSVLIYFSSRLFLSEAVSLLILVLALVAPGSVYSLFFMPEALYFLMFWLVCFAVLSSIKKDCIESGSLILIGSLVGLASLVKPHALFIAISISLYILTFDSGSTRLTLFARFKKIALFLIFLFAFKFIVGYLLAGKVAFTLFGMRYNNMAADNLAWTFSRVFELVRAALYIFFNHVGFLTFVYFIPFVGGISVLCRKNEVDTQLYNLSLFSFLLLGFLLAVTASFSSSVIGTNPYDVIGRIHMRYYSFILPLFLILTARMIFPFCGALIRPVIWVYIASFLLWIYGAILASKYLGGLDINWVDSPDLMFTSLSLISRWVVVLVGVIFSIAIIFRFHRVALFYLLLYIPLIYLLSNVAVQKEITARRSADSYDRAGLLIRQIIGNKEPAFITLVGPDESLLYKTSFYIDRTNTAIRIVARNGLVTSEQIPLETTHAIIFDDINYENKISQFIAVNGRSDKASLLNSGLVDQRVEFKIYFLKENLRE